ncbi:hypothetical protein SS37A_30690 [Methylocystis iwaonis]|uniref:ASCH domain-containing protein n=1 Tax=Methylocystis iwaonis TaxID=2885079 RepID=A0ABM8EC17_9HYPH|nr:hypothetical protein SS37A_30690 [Methylocystis iwaonis]
MRFEYTLDLAGRHAWQPQALKGELERRFPSLRSVGRSRFVMLTALAELVTANRKHTTIRYTPHAVEFPCESTLPLFVVEKGASHLTARQRGELRIARVQYKNIKDLNDQDAVSDGFRSRHELLTALQGFYGPLKPTDFVSIYHFVPTGKQPNVRVATSRRARTSSATVRTQTPQGTTI